MSTVEILNYFDCSTLELSENCQRSELPEVRGDSAESPVSLR